MLIRNDSKKPLVSFSDTWDVLGPFQIGTREASWGADPLERVGGFRHLERDAQPHFKSSLATNGLVYWSSQKLDTMAIGATAAEASLTVAFPDVNWRSLQSVYGWAALQYQAWARGYLKIAAESPQSIALYTDNVLEFWVDDKPFFGGDFYAFRRAPLVLHLEPGNHRVDTRVIRDVRAMGGIGEPKISIKYKAEICNAGLAIAEHKLIVSDVVNGTLASPFASVPVRNEGLGWLEIHKVEALTPPCTATMLESAPFSLAPGQSRPLSFLLTVRLPLAKSLSLKVTYAASESPKSPRSTTIAFKIVERTIQSPHKFTFSHPSGIVSYAILRAPSNRAISEVAAQRLPILLNLHGAGLEADSAQVRHTLDLVPDIHAWVIFPTGVTPWSSDDWHTWGFADVKAAAAAVPDWINNVGWKQPLVDVDRWLVSGHSNGGQGTWYALTHWPDKIIGAAPVSGYSSIQGYVPYQMWNEADPKVTSLVQSSLGSFRHELLVCNFNNIPVLQQHGSADDNVPAFHSRRMNQLMSQPDDETFQGYVELEDKGHWFEGVMSTEQLREFYKDILGGAAQLPPLPQKFRIVVANPANMASRGGLVVDQLCCSDQLGEIKVACNPGTMAWVLTTSNILRFHFSETGYSDSLPYHLIADKTDVRLQPGQGLLGCWFVRSKDGIWHVSDDRQWMEKQRHGAQLGPLDSIMRTSRRFLIRTSSCETFDMALQVTRNLFQYFAADAEIVQPNLVVSSQQGNVISLSLGSDFPEPATPFHSIGLVANRGLLVHRHNGQRRVFEFEEGLGAIFLRPLPSGRLELIIWGHDLQGLRQAARLVPMMTGVGQPEFVVVSKRCAWEGVAGVLAMGSFDNSWNVSGASYIT